jgi:transposase
MFCKKYNSSIIRKCLQTYIKVKSFRKTAFICKVSKSTIHRWWNSFHTFMYRPKIQRKKCSRKNHVFPNIVNVLKELFDVKTLTFKTLKSIQNTLIDSSIYSKKPSLSWIFQSLRNAKISRRRFNISSICNSNEDKILKQYHTFFNTLKILKDDQIVCIDETGFMNHNNSVYGYFQKGKTPSIVKQQKRQKQNLVMAIHPKGVISYKKQEQPFTSLSFLDFLKNDMLPNIPLEVTTIVMDNVSFHHSKVVQDIIKEYNLNILITPPYFPRCNPIEEVFSIMKRHFRNLNDDIIFQRKFEITLQDIKLYNNIQNNYKHTRQHVEEKCHNSES